LNGSSWLLVVGHGIHRLNVPFKFKRPKDLKT
jgi:hypothetical protein